MAESEAVTISDPFTVLNTIIGVLLYPLSLPFAFISQLPTLQPEQMPQLPPLPIKTPTSTSNKEKWEWVDYSGKKVVISVHRDVKYK